MLYWCGWKNTPKLYTLEMVNKHTSSRMAQQMLQRRAYLNYHRIFGILLVRTALPIGGEMNCCANTKDGTLLSAPINWRNDASSAIRQCATILQRLYFPASISRAFFTLRSALPKNADWFAAPIGMAHYKGRKKLAAFRLIGTTMPIHFALLGRKRK